MFFFHADIARKLQCQAERKRHGHDFCTVYYVVLLFSKWDILVRHCPSAFFFKSIMNFFTQSDCCITYIYLVDTCSCTCVCTWERVWYFCYPCPKSDSSSGCRSWTSNTQIVTTTNSTIYLSIFAMLIALEKMQRLDCTSVSGSNPSVQHSTQRNHWIPLHVQVTIWWVFLY